MSEMHERLKEARISAGFPTARIAAERVGVTYSTYAGHENGSRSIPAEAAHRYAKAFKSDPSWILFGGDPARVENGDPAPKDSALVPVFDVEASAGYGAAVGYEAEAYSLAFPPDYLRKLTGSAPKNLAIISVKGDSMEPTLLHDDIVLLDTSKTNLAYDGLFVLRFNDALHVKRVSVSAAPGQVQIISDNRDLYPPVMAPIADIHAVGKVLWYGRKV